MGFLQEVAKWEKPVWFRQVDPRYDVPFGYIQVSPMRQPSLYFGGAKTRAVRVYCTQDTIITGFAYLGSLLVSERFENSLEMLAERRFIPSFSIPESYLPLKVVVYVDGTIKDELTYLPNRNPHQWVSKIRNYAEKLSLFGIGLTRDEMNMRLKFYENKVFLCHQMNKNA